MAALGGASRRRSNNRDHVLGQATSSGRPVLTSTRKPGRRHQPERQQHEWMALNHPIGGLQGGSDGQNGGHDAEGRTAMKIPLERGPRRGAMMPLARQIQLHLERLIGQGVLRPGVKLPATRELAQELRVNRTTVATAYEELVAAGWARAHVGQGTFVAEHAPERVETPAAPAPPIGWAGLLSKQAQVVGAEARRRQAAMPSVRPGLRDHLVRGRHAGQRAVPHRRLPPRPERSDPRGGPRAPPVLPRPAATRRCVSSSPATSCASAWRRGRRRS